MENSGIVGDRGGGVKIQDVLAQARYQLWTVGVASQQHGGIRHIGPLDARYERRPRLAKRINRAERQSLDVSRARIDIEFLQLLAHALAAAVLKIELLDRLRP